MKVKDLIARLQELDQDADVYIPDQWYGEEGTTSKVEEVRAVPDVYGRNMVELGFL